MAILLPKVGFVHSAVLAGAIPAKLDIGWLDIALMIILSLALIYLFVGWLRATIRWNEEKQAHRRYGGTAPKK
jgi:membrane protein implicated in regulation of membrane protease activity